MGTMAKIDDSVKKKVPELRFKGFTDDWEERKLGQYTKLITKGTTPKDKTGIGDVNFVKVENITNGKIYPINKIKQNEHDNYLKRSRLEEKDILFSIAGTLGRTAIVNKSILPANTNQALAIIRGYDFDTNFLITSLAGNVVKEYIRRNPTVGAQPNLSLEQVGNLLVNTPNAEEQQKIGSFFKQLDDTIALHQRKLDLLKEQKKGFLQKMFPKNGAKVPELRFEGFADDWEERKLGDEFKKVSERNDGSFGRNHWISVAKMYFQSPEKVQSNNIDTRTYVMREGDIAFEGHPNSEFKFGRFVANDIGAGVVSELFPIYRHQHEYDNNYWKNAIQIESTMAPIFAKSITSSGNSSNKLDTKHFLRQKILVPQINEQKKIGSFFKRLDDTIALHQRKLDLLKEQKKRFLTKNVCIVIFLH